MAPGTYNNSASAASTNAKAISNLDGAANISDDVTVSASVGVSLYGTSYNDANHKLQLDGGESGTGLTLYAKLIPSTGGSALQAVAVNPSTGAYTLVTVTPGNYSIIFQAVFTHTNANPALAATLLVIDSTTVGANSAGLVLTKTTDKATALSGDTITYTVAHQNNSSTPISTIVISDATPAFTTFVLAGCALPLPAAISACSTSTQPAVGGQGGLQWTLTGALNPASAGQVVFAVKVN